MTWKFETLGNAIVQFFEDDKPVLVTDPWLRGTAYFGSWGIERPLTARQLENALRSPYVWISHGHPDHLDPDSLRLFDKQSCEILLPDHYNAEIRNSLSQEGFKTRVLRFKEWTPLVNGLRVMCLQNENMDAIIAVEAGGTLVLNKNDSPLCGEDRFFRRLMRSYDTTFLLSLCAVDADMLNVFDSEMRSLAGLPEDRKPGAIWAMSKVCDYLGATYFCCSSSQHVYLRPDSAWANPYRIGWSDMEKYWCSKATKLLPPYITVDLGDCSVANTPAETEASPHRQQPVSDDWNVPLTADEWDSLESFIGQFDLLKPHLDFIAFSVAGTTRVFSLNNRVSSVPFERLRGLTFYAPRGPLMEAVASGFFDDLLIGNFMKTQLHNATLYPHFTPIIAKLGGNAKVFTRADLRRFHWYFFKLSPMAFVTFRVQKFIEFVVVPFVRQAAMRLGIFVQAKAMYRLVVGSPKST